jgi:hypothetical protein
MNPNASNPDPNRTEVTGSGAAALKASPMDVKFEVPLAPAIFETESETLKVVGPVGENATVLPLGEELVAVEV